MHGLIYRLTIKRTHEEKAKVILWWGVNLIRKTHKRKRLRFLVYCVIYAFFSFSGEAPTRCAAIRSAENSEGQHRCRITVCLKPDEEPVELHIGDHTTTDEEDSGVYTCTSN